LQQLTSSRKGNLPNVVFYHDRLKIVGCVGVNFFIFSSGAEVALTIVQRYRAACDEPKTSRTRSEDSMMEQTFTAVARFEE
jgi:hypothetical protein